MHVLPTVSSVKFQNTKDQVYKILLATVRWLDYLCLFTQTIKTNEAWRRIHTLVDWGIFFGPGLMFIACCLSEANTLPTQVRTHWNVRQQKHHWNMKWIIKEIIKNAFFNASKVHSGGHHGHVLNGIQQGMAHRLIYVLNQTCGTNDSLIDINHIHPLSGVQIQTKFG